MTIRTLDETGVRKALRRACIKAGGPEQFASAHTLECDYVTDTLKGNCTPGSRILAALNLMKVSRYARMAKMKGRRGQ